MPITNVKNNENSRRKRNENNNNNKKQTNKDRNEQGGTEAIVKEWELNEFVVHLSCARNKPKFDLRYVDDILAAFENE